MKKFTSIILCAVFLLTLCSCGTTEQQPEETRIDNYTYEQEQAILNRVEAELSRYGFNYSVYVFESSDGKIDVSIDLRRASTGADEVFAETIGWSVSAVKKAKEEIIFELGELSVSFLLYDGPLDGEIVATMRFRTADLEKGNVFCATENLADVRSKSGATIEELQKYIIGATEEKLLKDIQVFQGEWTQDGAESDTLTINEKTLIFTSSSGDEQKYTFDFNAAGRLIAVDENGTPRYIIYMNYKLQLSRQSIESPTEDVAYNRKR